MAASIASSSSRLLPISKEPHPTSHFPSNFSKFASFPSYYSASRPSSYVSCSLTRDSSASVLPLEEQSKLSNGSVLFQRPDSFGRFGKFGGKYVPETLMHALTELEAAFHSLSADEDFQVCYSNDCFWFYSEISFICLFDLGFCESVSMDLITYGSSLKGGVMLISDNLFVNEYSFSFCTIFLLVWHTS